MNFAPQVLGTLVRRHGQFAACEDAVQEVLLAAALQWSTEGVPDRPRSWLLTAAGRSLVDEWRSESARRRREEALATLEPTTDQEDTDHWPADQDDTLVLPSCALTPVATRAYAACRRRPDDG